MGRRKEGPQGSTILVVDVQPIARRALAGYLAGVGFDLHETPELSAATWETAARVTAVVAPHCTRELDAAAAVACAHPELSLVLVLEDVSLHSCRQALQLGASTVVGTDATPEEIVDCVREAANERTVLPRALAQALACSGGSTLEPLPVTKEEIGWVEAMAQGATVRELAKRFGCSIREMHRRLKRLYTHMGVANRTEALVRAARAGLIG